MVLKLGSTGAEVVELQRLLGISPHDGIFGTKTRSAVIAVQRQFGLVQDGIVGEKTLAALRGDSVGRLLRQSDIDRAAADLGVPVAAVMAVNLVESRGSGFLSDGRPVILFERHIMRRQLGDRFDTKALQRYLPLIVNSATGGYEGGAAEHDRLYVARQIDPVAAVESASWGIFQIMGFHWQLLGYRSAEEFEQAMCESEGRQLDAFVRFIWANKGMHDALRARDWARFARLYNGPEYEKNRYDVKLAEAYRNFS